MESQEPLTERGALPSASFEDFFAREYDRVLAVVMVLEGTRAGAEDVAQEALVRAYLRWHDVRVMTHPAAWVKRVAVNLATSRRRRVAAEARALLRLRPVTAVTDVPLQDAAFWQAVRRLPPRQAQAVALHYADDLTIGQVAVVMGCADGTVKAHLHAARQRLESAFAEAEEGL